MAASPARDLDLVGTVKTRPTPIGPGRVTAQSVGLAQTGEYSILGLTGTADQTAVRERQLGFTLILFGVATVIALLYSIERYFYSRLVGYPVSLTQLVPAELIFTYAWALLTPFVMYTARRFPVWGRASLRNWSVQIGAMVAFVVIHIGIFSTATVVLDPAVTLSSLPKLFGQSMLSWT